MPRSPGHQTQPFVIIISLRLIQAFAYTHTEPLVTKYNNSSPSLQVPRKFLSTSVPRTKAVLKITISTGDSISSSVSRTPIHNDGTSTPQFPTTQSSPAICSIFPDNDAPPTWLLSRPQKQNLHTCEARSKPPAHIISKAACLEQGLHRFPFPAKYSRKGGTPGLAPSAACLQCTLQIPHWEMTRSIIVLGWVQNCTWGYMGGRSAMLVKCGIAVWSDLLDGFCCSICLDWRWVFSLYTPIKSPTQVFVTYV